MNLRGSALTLRRTNRDARVTVAAEPPIVQQCSLDKPGRLG